jgi:Tol biopolymer transport system component
LFPSLSPDGNQVTFSWNGPNQDNPDIYVQMIGGTGPPHRLTSDPANDYNPVWSPDGRWIAYLRTPGRAPYWDPIGRHELYLVPPIGGPEHLVAELLIREQAVASPRLAWCPDSKCLIVTDSPGEGKPDALFQVSADTGEKKQITRPQRPVVGDSSPAIAPDGQSMVFRRNIGFVTGELYWTAVGDGFVPKGQPMRLTHYTQDASFPAWTPDGRDILFCSRNSIWRMPAKGGRLATRLTSVGQDGIFPAVSRPLSSGKARLVYARNLRDWNFWRIERSDAAGEWERRPAASLSSSKLESSPRFSPKGGKIAFDSDRSGPSEIWVAAADGSNVYQITFMGASDTGSPEWSPDGQWVTFDSNLEGHYEVYTVAATGGKVRRVTFGTSHSQLPSFSADGRSIYFSSNRSGDFEIWKMPSQGGEAVPVTHNGGFGAWESPDGEYLYYHGYTNREIWRVPVSGGTATKILPDATRPIVLFQDGIYYRSGGAIHFFDFATNRSTDLMRNIGPTVPGLTVSPDRRTILYTRVDSTGADLMLVENFK